MRLAINRLSTPIGTLLLVSDDDGRVRALDFDDYEARMLRLLKAHYGDPTFAPGPAPASARRALDAYFEGDLTAIDDVQVATGGTPFQRTVWAALRRILAGRTTSYAALAATIGRPSAMRAVGLANGSNPVAIIVPCHRVIGADHSLAGYAGGLPRKRWLLEHEGIELSGSRVVLAHAEPLALDGETITDTVNLMAARLGLAVHHRKEKGQPRPGGRGRSRHWRCPRHGIPAGGSHPGGTGALIDTHIEPRSDHIVKGFPISEKVGGQIAKLVRDAAGSVELITDVRDIRAEQGPDGLYLTLHCLFDVRSR